MSALDAPYVLEAATCAEDDCYRAKRRGSDWCAKHGCRCEECEVPVRDGQDFCAKHFDPEAPEGRYDHYRGERRELRLRYLLVLECRRVRDLEAQLAGVLLRPVEPKVKPGLSDHDRAFMEEARRTIHALALECAEFSVNDVWRVLDRFGRIVPPDEPRCMGWAMVRARNDRWIEKLPGKLVPPDNKRVHGRPVQVWRSKLHAENGATG